MVWLTTPAGMLSTLAMELPGPGEDVRSSPDKPASRRHDAAVAAGIPEYGAGVSSLTWPASVDIREVGPRDGLQIEAPLSTAAKIRLLDALAATGVGRIEATAFVSPRAVPAMADAEEVGRSPACP